MKYLMFSFQHTMPPEFGGKWWTERLNTRLPLPTLLHYILHRVRNSFMGQCVRFYNRIPENVRECSISQFKTVVKRRLCVKDYYQINDYINDNTPWEWNARPSLFQSIIVRNVEMWFCIIDFKKISPTEFLAPVLLRSEALILVNWWFL